MTYHTFRCPHCGNVVGQTTGTPDILGNPFQKCPFCGEVYVASYTQEWATKSPRKRRSFWIGKPLAGAFLAALVVGGITVAASPLAALIVAAFTFAGVFALVWYGRKPTMQEEIAASLERTKSAGYVRLLEKSGFTIYPLEGVEIGTVEDGDSPLLGTEEEPPSESDRTMTLH